MLEVLYRNDMLIAVQKPAGMVIHRGWARDERTVYDILRDEVVGAPVFPLHRLDRGTSGVFICALNPEAAKALQSEMEGGQVRKRYLALVRGPMRDRYFVNHPVSQPDVDTRTPAQTELLPLVHGPRCSLVEARPLTGRSHQIRQHLKHISHPIVGDVRYGKGDINRMFREHYGLARLALHCWQMELHRPNETLLISAKLPPDLAGALHSLGIAIPE